MNLQEAKDQIAQNRIKDADNQIFYKDWSEFEDYDSFVVSALNEAAELYQSTVNKELREEVERLKLENKRLSLELSKANDEIKKANEYVKNLKREQYP